MHTDPYTSYDVYRKSLGTWAVVHTAFSSASPLAALESASSRGVEFSDGERLMVRCTRNGQMTEHVAYVPKRVTFKQA